MASGTYLIPTGLWTEDLWTEDLRTVNLAAGSEGLGGCQPALPPAGHQQ